MIKTVADAGAVDTAVQTITNNRTGVVLAPFRLAFRGTALPGNPTQVNIVDVDNTNGNETAGNAIIDP